MKLQMMMMMIIIIIIIIIIINVLETLSEKRLVS